MKFRYSTKILIPRVLLLSQLEENRLYDIETITVVGNFSGEKLVNEIRTDDEYVRLYYNGVNISVHSIWCDMYSVRKGVGFRNAITGDVKKVYVLNERKA